MCSNYPGIKLERRRKNENVFKMSKDKNARAKILFFIVKYANLWGSYCRRRRGCLSSLLYMISLDHALKYDLVKTPNSSLFSRTDRARFVCSPTLVVACF